MVWISTKMVCGSVQEGEVEDDFVFVVVLATVEATQVQGVGDGVYGNRIQGRVMQYDRAYQHELLQQWLSQLCLFSWALLIRVSSQLRRVNL